VSVEARVGVAVSGPLLASTATLLRHADQAMYQEKLARRGNR